MVIHRVIYRSTATRVLGDQELARMVEQARIHNFSQGITGMLLYAEGHLLQVLEGEPQAVALLYDQICNDPRHISIETLCDVPVAQRLSPDWSLGFGTVEIAALNRLAAFLDPKHQATLLPNAYDAKAFTTDLLRDFVEDERIFPRR